MKETKTHDLIIVGAGPSALAAAVYTTREDIDTLLIEKDVIGGLAAITDKVDNYLGFVDGISGLELAEAFEGQAKRFGAQITYGEVTGVYDDGQYKLVKTTDGELRAKAVLIATGSSFRKLDVPGETELQGRGVHYCATCDGAFYRGKRIAVIGGGNSAVQESIYLTRFTDHIDMLVRGSEIKASEVLIHELDKLTTAGKITVHFNTVTQELQGEANGARSVITTKDGQPTAFAVDGIFVFVGLTSNIAFLKDSGISLDEREFIITDDNLTTNIPGIFASGDVRSGATMQIASAVGEGATAALRIREYLEKRE